MAGLKAYSISALIGVGLISGAGGYWLGGPRQPETREPAVIESRVDYSSQEIAEQAWQCFPEHIKYGFVKQELQRMPMDELYSIGKSMILPRLTRQIHNKDKNSQDMQEVYSLLKDYLAVQK